MSSKWVIKQQRQLSINNTFGPGTPSECTVQWWFKKFCKDDSLEDKKHSGWPSEVDKDKKHSGWPSEVDKDQLRGSLKLFLLQPHEKLLKNSVSAILWSFST